MGQTKYKIDDLTELEYKLIINALKIWRGDFDLERNTQKFWITAIWGKDLDDLLTKLGFSEKGWPVKIQEGERNDESYN